MKNKIVVFLLAGISIENVKKNLSKSQGHYIRAITNVNTCERNAMTVIHKSGNQKIDSQVRKVFEIVGKVTTVDTEDQLDLLSILSACTPAIIALFYESLIESGMKIGVSKLETAEIIQDTIHQTLNTIKHSNISSRDLMQRVCTPGGLVVKALQELEANTDFKGDVVTWLPNILETLRNNVART